jgi:hypothetical protein
MPFRVWSQLLFATNGAPGASCIEAYFMLRVISEHSSYPVPQHGTTVAAIGLADVACSQTLAIVQAWKKWRGWHAMPASSMLSDADLGGHIAHASVARVVDGGRDYEFDFIGEAHLRAYGANHQSRRVSDIARLSPRFGRQLKASYDLVRISGHPHAFQGTLGTESADARFVWFETAYLPLGEQGTVDCVLNAAVYRLRDDAA